MFVAFYIVSMAMRELHADKVRIAREKLAEKSRQLKQARQRMSGKISSELHGMSEKISSELLGSKSTKHKSGLLSAAALGKSSSTLNVPEDTPVQAGNLRETLKLHAKTVANLFRELDEDGDGLIHPYEFYKMIPELGLKATQGEMENLFVEIDEDDNGTIDPDELERFFGANPDEGFDDGTPLRESLREKVDKHAMTIAQVFRDLDVDGDGLIYPHEFRRTLPALGIKATVKEIDDLFAEIDEDDNGVLNPDELEHFFAVKPERLSSAGAVVDPSASLQTPRSNRKRVTRQTPADQPQAAACSSSDA
jgi:Ca2+-binding EF-hand superfamily protein